MSQTGARAQIAGTARWIAAARARESARPDRLFDDPWAAELAGPDGVEMLHAREPGGRENAFLPVRTRFFDDLLARVCTGAGAGTPARHQVVLLGAGMDTRAYRLPLPAGTSVFELDHDEVLDAKAGVLGAVAPRCERRAVPADLGADWARPLLAAGFDPARPTVWVAEGVLYYLTAPQVHALLGTAASLSAGDAVFGADVFGTGLLRLPALRPLVEHRSRTGTPLPYCTDEPGTVLERAGWQPGQVVEAGQPAANYGRLTPRPEHWDGGADPTTRSYLLVGSRQAP